MFRGQAFSIKYLASVGHWFSVDSDEGLRACIADMILQAKTTTNI